MQRYKKRCRGAVSIFLTLVLVPCIIFVCAFGDLSRVQLSKATAESAADLSLYSLMSHYDADLKEFYGLIASCQDIDDYYEKTAEYFTGMLTASGIDDLGSDLFLAYVQSLQDEDISDFLQSEILSVEVSAVSNAALGENPALIEDGIVEFMKYRGPVSILSDIIERFTDMNLDNAADEASENQEIVEKRQEYAETEGELLEAAFYSYLAINDYFTAWSKDTSFPSAEGYSTLSDDLSDIWNDLGEVTELVTKYYFPDTDDLSRVSFPLYDPDKKTYTYGTDTYTVTVLAKDVGEAVDQEDGSTIYCLDKEALDTLLENLGTNIANLESAANAVADACSGIYYNSGDTNPAVYLLEVQNAVSDKLSSLNECATTLLEQYAKLVAAQGCEPYPDEADNDLPQNWEEQLTDAIESIENVLCKYLSESGASSSYISLVSAYNSYADDNLEMISNRSYTFYSSYTGKYETLDSFAKKINERLSGIADTLEDLIERLDRAIDGGKLSYSGSTRTVPSLDKLVDKVTDYVEAREDWIDEIYSHETEYAESEQKSYEEEEEKLAEQITEEAVSELKARLENIRSDMLSCLDALKGFTYGETKVSSISSGETLIKLARTKVSDCSDGSLSQNEVDASGYFSALISPATEQVYTAPDADSAADGNNPNLSANQPVLYEYFRNRFQGEEKSIDEAISERKDKETSYKEQEDDAQEEAESTSEKYLEKLGGDISDGHGGETVSIASVLSSISNIVSLLFEGEGDELRDKLYVCQYIMTMFSYSSFDNEGLYQMAVDSGKTVALKDFPYVNEEDKQKWFTASATELYGNQSLTNRPIDQDHNQANLGEVEYILYGGDSTEDNLSTSYGNIFAIRLALNLVSGFCNFYTPSTNDLTALAIQTAAHAVYIATAGVIPEAVTKCLLIGVLAALESARDLERLKAGLPVAFYKSSADDWYYSIETDSDGSNDRIVGDGSKDVDENGLFYSDYMYLFLMIGLTSDAYDDMLLRVGDLIEANIKKTEDSDFDLSKSICYFQLTATVRVNPLLLTLPVVGSMDGVDASGVLSVQDWCTYQLKVYRGYS